MIIYSLPNCPNCRKLKAYCDENNIKYVNKDITEDFRAKARLIRMATHTCDFSRELVAQIVSI